LIRWKIGSYPSSTSDGNLLPLQTGINYIHDGLTPGTSYYYKLWGEDGGSYSATYNTTMCTTLAGGNASALPAHPSDPGFWTIVPDSSSLVGLPFYGTVTDIGDTMHIPEDYWWMMLMSGLLLTCGFYVYSRSLNITLASLIVALPGFALSIVGIFPGWTMFVFIIVAVTVSWKELR
jgi:hypothetical protein